MKSACWVGLRCVRTSIGIRQGTVLLAYFRASCCICCYGARQGDSILPFPETSSGYYLVLCRQMVAHMGVEPNLRGYEPRVLPLHYSAVHATLSAREIPRFHFVAHTGFTHFKLGVCGDRVHIFNPCNYGRDCSRYNPDLLGQSGCVLTFYVTKHRRNVFLLVPRAREGFPLPCIPIFRIIGNLVFAKTTKFTCFRSWRLIGQK